MDKVTLDQILKYAGLFLNLGIAAVEARSKDDGKSVEEVLAEADANWDKAKLDAQSLLSEGN